MSLKKHFDLVVFDWAGTVVDFGCQAPVQSLIEAFAADGIRIDGATARRDMGVNKRDHVSAILAEAGVAAAWQRLHGRAPDESSVDGLITRLTPLMRAHAAAASTLIPGALDAYRQLRAAGLKIASSTGYTRDMLQPVLERAAAQGYVPDHVVCSGETQKGRPSPLMLYKTCLDLGIWPMARVVKVDDAEAGVAEGRCAGALTIGVASGNLLGLSLDAMRQLTPAELEQALMAPRRQLTAAGADMVVDFIGELPAALVRAAAQRIAA
jgi:phosphonoacetaldehyde hydrolase